MVIVGGVVVVREKDLYEMAGWCLVDDKSKGPNRISREGIAFFPLLSFTHANC
jgi:hypothetical protein